MITIEDFDRVNNDVNGNPRYVCHFLQLSANDDCGDYQGLDRIIKKYNIALNRSRELGGRKFHNKQYGGGIVFQSYNLAALCADINSLMEKERANHE